MKNKIEDLRNHLFETIELLKDGDEKETKMTVDKAKAIAELSGQIIDSAKVELNYMRLADEMNHENYKPGFLPDAS